MSLEENKAVVRRLYEAVNTQDLSSIEDFMAPDYVDHTRKLRGLEENRQYMTMLYKASPDIHGTVEDIIAERDRVWVRVKYTGTHKGELRGLAPTGKTFNQTSIDIYRISDGKVMDGWSFLELYTHLAFFKQLGVIEYTEKGKKFFPENVA